MWGFTLLDKQGNKVISTSALYETERYAFVDGYESCADYPEAYSFYTWKAHMMKVPAPRWVSLDQILAKTTC